MIRRLYLSEIAAGRLPQQRPPRFPPAIFCRHLPAPWVYTASVYSTTIYGGAYEHEPEQDLVGRFGGRRGLDTLEFSCGQVRHHRCALRGGPACGILSEDAALSFLRSPVDRNSVYSGDCSRASVRLDTAVSGAGSGHRTEDRLSCRLSRRLPE